jgi:CheY-like chemotaxis protein
VSRDCRRQRLPPVRRTVVNVWHVRHTVVLALIANLDWLIQDPGVVADEDVSAHERKAHTGGREAIPAHLPRKQIPHDLPNAQKHCEHEGVCWATERIGEEISERYHHESPKVWVERHVRLKWACGRCHQGVHIAPSPANQRRQCLSACESRVQSVAVPEELGLSPTDSANEPRSPRRILVADDLADSADSVSMLLAATEHDVQAVYDGTAALERATALRSQVIFLDLGMPGIDGFDVCSDAVLRQSPQSRVGGKRRIVGAPKWRALITICLSP